MTLLLIGFNHKTTPVELRERLFLSSEILKAMLIDLQQAVDVEEVVILSTCNRFEIYAIVNENETVKQDIIVFISTYYDIDIETLLTSLYIYEDEVVVDYLMRVSAGLESMMLGESQILGQVSQALQNASSAKTTGTYLHRLFEVAIHTGKRARTETQISQHTTSISHAAALLMKTQMPKPDPKVLVLGAGEMAELAILAIHKLGLSNLGIINRTYSKAHTIAEKFGVKAYSWSELWQQIHATDVVITATGADHILLHRDDLKAVMQTRNNHRLLLIDISLPRNIASESADIEGIELHDIDALKNIVDHNLSARKACIPEVNNIIQQEANRYQDWVVERSIVPVIKDLRREVENMIEIEVNLALNKMTNISDSDTDIVKRMAHRITNKILHKPTKNLRLHASDSDSETYATVLRELFALNTSDERL